MEHTLTISLEDFDDIYTDVDWYGRDEDERESDEEHKGED